MASRTYPLLQHAWLFNAERNPSSAERHWRIYFARHPVIAAINTLAWRGAVMVGPMCWAALIVLFFWGSVVPGR